jgi:hypothetical protein
VHARIASIGPDHFDLPESWIMKLPTAKDAMMVESIFHGMFRSKRHDGNDVPHDGKTEWFHAEVLPELLNFASREATLVGGTFGKLEGKIANPMRPTVPKKIAPPFEPIVPNFVALCEQHKLEPLCAIVSETDVIVSFRPLICSNTHVNTLMHDVVSAGAWCPSKYCGHNTCSATFNKIDNILTIHIRLEYSSELFVIEFLTWCQSRCHTLFGE